MQENQETKTQLDASGVALVALVMSAIAGAGIYSAIVAVVAAGSFAIWSAQRGAPAKVGSEE